MLRALFRTWILCVAVAGYAAPAFSQASAPDRNYARDFLQRYGVAQVPPPELVPIVEAMKEHRLKDAIQICDELIARNDTLFRNKTEASWIKSEAYRYRADATYRINGSLREAIALLKPAADMGNLRADKKITEIMWRKFEGDPEYASVEASPEQLAKYLRIGAELGDARSATMLGASNSFAGLDEREKVYWSLVGFALAINDEQAFRRRMIADVIRHAGTEKVTGAIKEYSLLPPTTPAGPGALAGRGLVTTIYADATLRRDYGFSYGRRGTEGTPSGPTPDVQEIFKAIQAYAGVVGDIRAFLLIPGTRQFEDPSILSVPKDDLASLVIPSDTIFVRCGGLPHVAMVHHVDRAQNRIYLSDGLWEFWQPSHNSCITHFDLVPFQHGGFLVAVPLSEFGSVLKAVSTLRDAPGS